MRSCMSFEFKIGLHRALYKYTQYTPKERKRSKDVGEIDNNSCSHGDPAKFTPPRIFDK